MRWAWWRASEVWILGYAEDPVLRPILVSLAGHAVVLVAPLMLAVWRSGSVWAELALAVLFVASARMITLEWRHRGAGGMTAALVGSWLGGVALAVFAQHTGVL